MNTQRWSVLSNSVLVIIILILLLRSCGGVSPQEPTVVTKERVVHRHKTIRTTDTIKEVIYKNTHDTIYIDTATVTHEEDGITYYEDSEILPSGDSIVIHSAVTASDVSNLSIYVDYYDNDTIVNTMVLDTIRLYTMDSIFTETTITMPEPKYYRVTFGSALAIPTNNIHNTELLLHLGLVLPNHMEVTAGYGPFHNTVMVGFKVPLFKIKQKR